MSGGIKGFAKLAEKYVKTERGALLSVWAVTPATFLDCCFHVVATGTVSKPLMEKVNGSKEKLAFIINVTSSQLIVLIPFATTYVGYIVGVVASSMRKAGLVAFSHDSVEAELSLKQGDIETARRWAEKAGLAPADAITSLREQSYHVYARLLTIQKRFIDAETLLVGLEKFQRAGGRCGRLINTVILQAVVHQELGRKDLAALCMIMIRIRQQ